MAFEFIFAKEERFSKNQLQQGDILQRTVELQQVLGETHRYYADAPDYTHFMVLTQSCDLVRRHGSGTKSRYITLAAAKPPEKLIERLIERYSYNALKDFPVTLYRQEEEGLVKNILERLLHNTQDGYFFIPGKSHSAIPKSLCVFLPLSVSLRICHYEVCLKSKIAQLDGVFQAKVGWLAGNQYSRIATPDIEDHTPNDSDRVKQELYDELLYQKTVWMTSLQYGQIKKAVKRWKRENRGRPIDGITAKEILRSLPTNSRILAERVVDQLRQKKLLASDDTAKERALNLLENDNVLKAMTRSE